MTTRNRIEGLDLIRIIAIFGVILHHCFSYIFPINDMEYFANLSIISRAFYFGCYSTAAMSVPLFFFISGYLLLPRDFDSSKTIKFYRRNLLPLLLTWEVWIPIYNLLNSWYYNTAFHGSLLLRNMFFVEPVHVIHSWYMPAILGIYIFIPYLSRVLSTMSNREIFIPITIAYFYYLVLPTLNHLKQTQWGACLDLSFSGGLYGLYVILGYLMYRYEAQLKNLFNFNLTAVILIIFNVLLQMLFYSLSGKAFNLGFYICTFPLAAAATFMALKDIKLSRFKNLILNISNCTFGMYLSHMLFIFIFTKYELLDFISSKALRIIILAAVVYILSFILVTLLKKLPYIGKILTR